MSFGQKIWEYEQQKKAQQEQQALQEANPGALILTPSLSGDKSGSNNLAKVHRAEWQDYLNRFAPIENKLFERFYDETDKAAAVSGAGDVMSDAFDRSLSQEQRDYSRMGLSMTPAETKQRETEHALNKSAAIAGAKNSMRQLKDDQKMGIMSGGLSTVTQSQGG